MAEPVFRHVALIGIGLIGSSLGHIMRQNGLAGHVSGFAKSSATRDKAIQLKIVDEIHDNAADAAKGADLIILCTPVGAFKVVAAEIGPVLKPGAIVTDVGSVKEAVVRDCAPFMPAGVHLIPGHPVAGTEQSGPESGFADLFDNRWVILTPPDDVDEAAFKSLVRFWEGCGSNVEIMTPDHHDLVLAITSHIPHLIAYNIVGTADDLEQVTRSEVIKYSAGGFRDFTRIAASDPTMWRDVFVHNKDAVLEMLGRFTEDLTDLQRAIRRGDADRLFEIFTKTRSIRRRIIDAGQETEAPDFGRHTTGSGSD